jgi:hypothetical protein
LAKEKVPLGEKLARLVTLLISLALFRCFLRSRCRLAQQVTENQSDQMSLCKISPKTWPNTFLTKLMYNLNFGKSSFKMWATSAIIKSLPKVNNPPLGENLPNLVTLRRIAELLK